MAGVTAMISPLLSLVLSAAAMQSASIAPAPAIDGPVPLAWRWVQSTKVPPSGTPSVDGRTIYLAVDERVFALSADSGNELWKFPTVELLQGKFRVSPVKAGDTLVIPTDAGMLYGLDASTGKMKWMFPLANLGPKMTVVGQPTVAGGRVVAAMSDNTLMAFDPVTGQPAWQTGATIPNGCTGRIAAHGDNVIALTHANEMLSVSSLTSKILWTTKFAAIDVDAIPIIQGDTAYINSGNFLVAVNAVTGRGRWQTDLGEPIAFGPAVGPNGVLVVTRDGKGLIYNLNGRRTLKDPVDVGSAPVTVPTAVGEMYLVPTANGAINLVEPKEGKVIWSFVIRPLVPPTGGNTKVIEAQVVDTRLLSVQAAGPAVVAGNTILVLAQDGSLLAFDPETGVDLTPPEAFMVWPMPGSQVSGQPPLELVFKVDDEATGVKIDTLKIDIDGNPVEFTVGRDLVAVVRFSHSGPNKPLMDGRKVINLSVEDWMGNVQKKSYSLSIDNMLPPLQRPGAAPAKPTQPSGGGRPGRRGGTGPGV